MTKPLTLVFLLLCSHMAMAQNIDTEIVGNYNLKGVPEVASGFQLNADHSFQFFFSYGVLERSGSGTWLIEGDAVVLKSNMQKVQDYQLVKSRKRNNTGIKIKIVDENPYLAELVSAQVNNVSDNKRANVDENGIIFIDEKTATSIWLYFKFCPEKFSKFEITKPGHNYFEFKLLPSLFDLFFDNYKLLISQNELKGKHPLLDEKEYTFIKN